MKLKLALKSTVAALLLFMSLQGIVLGAKAPEARSESAPEQHMKPVQVFGVEAGKVIKVVPNDEQFQEMAKSWLNAITGPAPQITSDKDCLYVFRVPLKEPATIVFKEIKATSNDVYLFHCKNKPPVLLLFDEKRHPYLFLFKGDIGPFIKKIGLAAK